MSENLTAGRQLPGSVFKSWLFTQDAVAASQTAAAMNILETATNSSNASLGVTSYVAPFAGAIVGISLHQSAAAAGGAITVVPTINGTAQTDPSASTSASTTATDTASRGKVTFSAGDLIGVALTTAAGYSTTTNDLVVEVHAFLEPSGV